MNIIVGIDGTLSGYSSQHRPSSTGLRFATLCFAIQPLWGKDKSRDRDRDLVAPFRLFAHFLGDGLIPYLLVLSL